MEKYIEKSEVERMLWAVIMSKDERTIKEMLEDASIVNAIPIPDNTTNGDVIKAMFPNYENRYDAEYEIITGHLDKTHRHNFDSNWWNTPYQKGPEE